ncbi:DUF3347 domain-containing protein [Chitinophaga qingshengii]|uniref:DUF3347 domain-containing protein n=1 Tax=Chitinophaga qingshengii TaxID=1569794 RepID=A0ABR7TEP4_9BACT|nr:DUF3347 domain-containing protein [Chitinophaga qingshengii]MBC9928748.1 DUF3347 domain-containing protein [Chitinophaga qingshengii]
MNFRLGVPVGTLCMAFALFGCQSPANKSAEEPAAAPVAALQAPYNQVYYDSLQVVMQAYYQLSDALVKADSAAANTAAASLKGHMDSLPVNTLQMDSSHLSIITGTTGSISAELAGFEGEKDLEGKRSSFQMVSDMLFDLVKNTGLKGKTVYHQYCPMAFDDKGAYWLSDKPEILNPYFGNKMLHCGETKDTLSYQ